MTFWLGVTCCVKSQALGVAYPTLMLLQPVANADENVDGKVSLEEWKHATARRFAHLDKAKTGRLILSDLILPKDKQPKDDKRGKPPGGG